MAMNGSGIRDTARVLRISPTTVIEALKKHRHLEPVNQRTLASRQGAPSAAMVVRVEADVELCPVEAAATLALARH